jgi:WhiB family redox-sensing transcriptional regulator
MSNYSGSVPETPRKPSWRDTAACSAPHVDPELFHAGERDHASANEARQVCDSCPVRAACLTDAYQEDDRWAIRGGLSHRQRIHYLKRNDGDVGRAVAEAVVDKNTLLHRIYLQHTRREGAHRVWTDPRQVVTVRQTLYTVRQLAFIAVHGAPPVGAVKCACTVEGCVGPDCLTDRPMRDAAKFADAA